VTAPTGLPHVVLSGPLSVGKTTLAGGLAGEYGYEPVYVREVLRLLAEEALASRASLQEFGRNVEMRTGGRWLAEHVRRRLMPRARPLVIDAIRTNDQLRALHDLLRPRVAHVHLTARPDALVQRFSRRDDPQIVEAPSLDAAAAGEFDAIEDFAGVADLTVETTSSDPASVLRGVVDWLQHRP
jgi:adenylosuccinate synthase